MLREEENEGLIELIDQIVELDEKLESQRHKRIEELTDELVKELNW